MKLQRQLIYVPVLIGVASFLAASSFSPVASVGESCCQRRTATQAKTAPLDPVEIIHEFNELEPVDSIALDASQLKDERNAILPGKIAQAITSDGTRRWKDYDQLKAQAEASDALAFGKEFALHRLRVNDYLFRQKLCEGDFQTYFHSHNALRGPNSRPRVASSAAVPPEVTKLQNIEKQTSAAVQSLNRTEQALRSSVSQQL